MGVTIEQYYRARIGARNNVRIELDSTQLEGNFCDAMLNVDVIPSPGAKCRPRTEGPKARVLISTGV